MVDGVFCKSKMTKIHAGCGVVAMMRQKCTEVVARMREKCTEKREKNKRAVSG